MLPAIRRKVTYDEYLELERATDLRHEFLDGEVWAMSGGTPRHSAIKTNLVGELHRLLGDGPCRSYDSDLKVRVLATGLATYPDLTVVCGPIDRHPDDPNAVTNPTAVFEVLSESTEAWDRGGKFRHLGQIPSLRHYVLVGQDPQEIEVYTRQVDEATEQERWELVRYGAGLRVPLTALGVELERDRVYRNLPPEP